MGHSDPVIPAKWILFPHITVSFCAAFYFLWHFQEHLSVMFRAHVEKKRQAEKESVDAFYNLLDQIPTFWRDSDAPVEQMLTT